MKALSYSYFYFEPPYAYPNDNLSLVLIYLLRLWLSAALILISCYYGPAFMLCSIYSASI